MPEEKQRVHDKINFETNVVDPKTFAILLTAVKNNQPLSYEKGRDDVFPKARSAAGMQWNPDKKDTHASGTLEQYGLVNPDENRSIVVSDLGYKFLSCFDSDFNVIVESDTYKTILLEMILFWKEEEHGHSIHPGRILFKLLLDDDLGHFITSSEFALWTSSQDALRDRDYDKIKNLIIEFRKKPVEIEQKKAEVFLRPFANSWDLFDRTINNKIYTLTIKKDVLPLVQQFFIPVTETIDAGEISSEDILEKIVECWNSKNFYYVDVKPLYDEFNSLFGLPVIKNFTSDECLDKLFGRTADNSLVYNLEHVTKFTYFAHVGGYRTIYTLYEKDGEWKYGNSGKNIKVITRDEAKEIAKNYRDAFVTLFEFIEKLINSKEQLDKNDFLQIQQCAKNSLGILYGRDWVWKYCHMIYPTIFTTFFSDYWINKIFRVAQLIPESTYLLQCYQYYLLCNKVELLNVYVYHILEALDDSEANLSESIDELSGQDEFDDAVYRIKNDQIDYSEEDLKKAFKEEFDRYKENKWVGVIALGAKFGNIVSGKNAKKLLESIGMPSSSLTEYTKGKSLADYIVLKSNLIPVSLDSKSTNHKYDEYTRSMTAFGLKPFESPITSGENLVVYGTPGCGKSFHVENVILPEKKISKVNRIRTTFFQDYTNTDFVGQVLPKINGDNVTYEFNPGPFTLALAKALEFPNEHIGLVIEELNRGNAASIFGDIFQLLDRKEDGSSRYEITNVNIQDYLISYFKNLGVDIKLDTIKIPGNMSIIATMNTSDQNVFTLDTAFKRRWKFEKLKNEFINHKYENKLVPGMHDDITWKDLVKSINLYIVENADMMMNEDKQIGVYFIEENQLIEKYGDANSKNIKEFAYKLFEYLWDDVAKFSRTDWFKNAKTLDQLIEEYEKNGQNVFKDGIIHKCEEENK